MSQSRRTFLGLAAVWAATAGVDPAWGGQADASQRGPGSKDRDPFDVSGRDPDGLKVPSAKDVLAANDKSIKKDVARLSDLVGQMQKQLEEKDAKDVLSLDVLRDTDEIERLARHIRTLIRG